MTSWTPSPSGGPPPKKGMSTGAVVAIVLGAIAVFVLVVGGIVAAIAVPSLIRARAAANESSAIGTLRMVASAEATYYSRNETYGDVADLVRADMLDPDWHAGMERNSYRFEIVRADEEGFEAHAEPIPDHATAGERSYTVTEDSVIRYADGSKAPPGTSGRVLGGP